MSMEAMMVVLEELSRVWKQSITAGVLGYIQRGAADTAALAFYPMKDYIDVKSL